MITGSFIGRLKIISVGQIGDNNKKEYLCNPIIALTHHFFSLSYRCFNLEALKTIFPIPHYLSHKDPSPFSNNALMDNSTLLGKGSGLNSSQMSIFFFFTLVSIAIYISFYPVSSPLHLLLLSTWSCLALYFHRLHTKIVMIIVVLF